jgi:hypothetical protein
MKKMILKTIATFDAIRRNSISPATARHTFIFVPLVLACFGLSPTAQAVSPTPDGGYAGANTAEGGNGALFSLTTGTNNTALGASALFSLTTGIQNTATGAQALKNNTGNKNTADGFQALCKNTIGDNNVATGWRALFNNTTGVQNTANGVTALFKNTNGIQNTATGFEALFSNTAGDANTATGQLALAGNTTGSLNTANGANALFSNTIGNTNTAVGDSALALNSTGGGNIALGFTAGFNLTTGNYNIDIGNAGVAAEANTIRIGTQGTQTATFIAGISGATASGGVAVYVNTDGKLGTLTSSARFKNEIKPMDKASEAILALKPVTFRYKKEIDRNGIPQFGLVAEEVEKVNPALVARDAKGKPYTVRYEAVNAMLLNEFLKEHRAVQELKSTVSKQEATAAEQQKEIKALTAALKEQAAQIQKVSARLEVTKPAPQMVSNDQR